MIEVFPISGKKSVFLIKSFYAEYKWIVGLVGFGGRSFLLLFER